MIILLAQPSWFKINFYIPLLMSKNFHNKYISQIKPRIDVYWMPFT